MQRSMKKHSGQLCDICGDVGYAELLSTCSVCHASHEHIYCMRKLLEEVPKSWICEACQQHNDIVSPKSGVKECLPKAPMSNTLVPNKFHGEEAQIADKKQKTLSTGNDFPKLPDSSKTKIGLPMGKPAIQPFSRNNISKKVRTGKVKFLPTEDVCALTSRPKTKAFPSSSRTDSFVTWHQPISKRTASLSVTVAPKFTHHKDLIGRPPIHSKPLTLGSPHTSSSLLKQPVKPSQPLSGEKSPPHILCKSSIPESSRSKKTEVHIGKQVDLQTKKRRFSEVPQTPSNRFGSTEESDVTGLLGLDKSAAPREVGTSSSNLLSTVRKEHPNPPAIKATWMGSFEILAAVYQREVYDGLRANPPGKVSRKAYEFSKQMPGTLQFNLRPRSELWPDTFHLDFPAANDIAIYFFPDDVDRSNQKYYGLLELIEKNDLALQSCLGGVELLIFTSKQLPVDSQRWKMKFYLWGVFHSVNGRRLHARSAGSIAGVPGPENVVGPSQNVLPKVHSPRPIERTTGLLALVEVNREQGVKLHPSGFSIPFTRDATDKQPMREVNREQGVELHPSGFSMPFTRDATDKQPMREPPLKIQCDLEAPPGFSKPLKLKERDHSSEVIRKQGKALMADANATKPSPMESRSFESGSRGVFKGLSLLPEKLVKGLEPPEVHSKCRQVISYGPPMDSMATNPESLSRKSGHNPPSSPVHADPKGCNQHSSNNCGLEGPPENFRVWDDPEKKGKRSRDERPGDISQKKGSSSTP